MQGHDAVGWRVVGWMCMRCRWVEQDLDVELPDSAPPGLAYVPFREDEREPYFQREDERFLKRLREKRAVVSD